MPLVKVSDNDVASFDTFDVAEMADSRNQQQARGWFSRRARDLSHPPTKDTSTPLEENEQTSLDTSIKTNGTGSAGSVAASAARRYSAGGLSRHSNPSAGSLNSYGHHSAQAISPPKWNYPDDSHYQQYHKPSSGAQHPIYENVENLDEIQHDPRTKKIQMTKYGLDKKFNPISLGHRHIPEEDGTESLSTMEESSITQHQQQHNQSLHSPHQHSHLSSFPHSQQHMQPTRKHQNRKCDDSTASVSSTPVLSKGTDSDFSSYTNQLESLVAKLNFELATTKSSLDELQLENRHLHDAKEKMSKNIRVLREENEQLHTKMEKLEKERLLRTMERTIGVARYNLEGSSSILGSSALGSAASVSGNIRSYRVQAQKLSRKISIGSIGRAEGEAEASSSGVLEVPFRGNRSKISLTEGYLTDENCLSPENSDIEDAQSVALSWCGDALQQRQHHVSQDDMESSDVPEIPAQSRPQGLGFFSRIGGGKKQQLNRFSKQTGEASISVPPRIVDRVEKGATSSKPQDIDWVRGEDDSDIAGSNPSQEEYDSDDPFATCYSSKGNDAHKIWFRRGAGSGRTGGRSSHNSRNKEADGRRSSRDRPQSNDHVKDPFDSRDGSGGQDIVNNAETYTSFGAKSSMDSGSDGSCSIDGGTPMARERKGGGFQLFLGFGGQQRRR